MEATRLMEATIRQSKTGVNDSTTALFSIGI